MKSGRELSREIPEGFNSFVHTIFGEGNIFPDVQISEGSLALFGENRVVIEADLDLEFVLFSGKPFGEGVKI